MSLTVLDREAENRGHPTGPPPPPPTSRAGRVMDALMSPRCINTVAGGGSLVLLVSLVAAGLGLGAAIVAAVILTAVVAAKWSSRRFPQATGSVVATLAMIALALLLASVMAPVLMAAGSVEMGFGFVIAPLLPTLAVWLSPHRGVHRGWSTAVGQVPVLTGLLASLWFPGASAAWALGSAVVGVLMVLARSRLSLARRGDTENSRGHRWIRRVGRGGGIAVVSVATAGMVMMAAPPQAEAQLGLRTAGNALLCGIVSPGIPSPQPVGTGMESVVAPHNMTGLPAEDGSEAEYLNTELRWPDGSLDSYTLFELSGLRGINYMNWVKDSDGEQAYCGFMPWVSVMAGNAINTINKFGLQITIWLKEVAQVQNPFRFLYDPFSPLVTGFVNAAFSLFALAFVTGIIVFMVRAVRGKNLSQAASNMTGALLTAFITAVMYGGIAAGATWNSGQDNFFRTVVSWMDGAASTLNAGLSNQMLSWLPEAEGGMCILPTGQNVQEDGQRYSSCLLAEAMAYQPWALATFGPDAQDPIEPETTPVAGGVRDVDDDNEGAIALPCYNDYRGCNDLRTYIISQIGGPDITGRVNACLNDNGYDSEASDEDNHTALQACEPYHAVAGDLQAKASADGEDVDGGLMLASFQGETPGSAHSTQSLTSLVAIFTVGLGIAVIAAATMYWHGRLLILFVMGPFILSMAAFRGVDGTMKWLSNVAQSIIARLIYGVLTTFLIVTVSVVTTMDQPFGIRIMILIVIIASVMKMLRKSDEFSQIGNSDGGGAAQELSKSKLFSSALYANVASNAITGGAKAMGRGGRWGAGKAATGVGAGARATGRGVEAASRPVRNATNTMGGQIQARRNLKGYTGDPSQPLPAAQAAGDNAGSTAASASGSKTAQTAAATAATASSKPTAAAAGTTAAAAGAAANTRRPEKPSSRAQAPDTQPTPAEQGRTSTPKSDAAAAEQPEAGQPQNTSRATSRAGRAMQTTRAAASGAGESLRSGFSRPTSEKNARARNREELFLQRKREENYRRGHDDENVLSIQERRKMRAEVNALGDEDVIRQNKRLTADQKAQRIAELKKLQEQGEKDTEKRTDKRHQDREARRERRSPKKDRRADRGR